MLYAILCYNNEVETTSWSKEKDAEVMTKLKGVQDRYRAQGRLGPVARLQPTTAAITLNKNRDPAVVFDGPFAETKEQLLGFYMLDCETQDEALRFARELGAVNPGGSYEIRPVATFLPNNPK